MKPITTTHELLEAAARLLEKCGEAHLAEDICGAKVNYIPDEPLTLGMKATNVTNVEAATDKPYFYETNAAPSTPENPGPSISAVAAPQSDQSSNRGTPRTSGDAARKDCEACKGRGHIMQGYHKPPKTCSFCDGTGVVLAEAESRRLGHDLERHIKIAADAQTENRELREATIEECARVAEAVNQSGNSGTYSDVWESVIGEEIADAIRALKDKGKE